MNESNSSPTRQTRVVIADDDPSVRLLLKHFLDKENYLTQEASNGIEALSLCEQYDVDMILLDAIMPEMNGFDACQKIKETNPDLVVIIITGLDDDSSVEQAFNSGADDYITKPINWSVLKHRIVRVKNRGAGHALEEANELFEEINNHQYSVELRPRLDILTEEITAIMTNYHHLGPQKKRLLKLNSALPLKSARQLIEDSCQQYKLHQQANRMTISIYPFSGNPLQYVNMLNDIFDKSEISLNQLDCVFYESQIHNKEMMQLYNAISALPVNMHIGKCGFSLRSLELIKSSRCNAIELDMPLIHHTLGNNYDEINSILQAYRYSDLKLIAADISSPEEINIAKHIHCAEIHGPALGIGKIN